MINEEPFQIEVINKDCWNWFVRKNVYFAPRYFIVESNFKDEEPVESGSTKMYLLSFSVALGVKYKAEE